MREHPGQKQKPVKSERISKKTYKTPQVTVYGSVTQLTAAKSSGVNRDGVANKKT